jgi:hypothetical protein
MLTQSFGLLDRAGDPNAAGELIDILPLTALAARTE